MTAFKIKDNFGSIPDFSQSSLHSALIEAKVRAKNWNRTIIVANIAGEEWVVFPNQKVVKRKSPT